MFNKVLIANRGAIATRVTRTLKTLGVKSIAVFAEADRDSLHVSHADEAYCLGVGNARETYLNQDKLFALMEQHGVDAVHPGYGFLSENPDFVKGCEARGIAFIGPTPDHIRLMGDKIAAKKTMRELGVPVVPGYEGQLEDMDVARREAGRIGYPVLAKAASGGGGRGMKVINDESELEESLTQARNEAMHAFGDDTMYMEKYLPSPRHIEVQVFGDGKGNAIHLGERDCSLQRRHQKVLEEAPSPALNSEQRNAIGERAAKAVAGLEYRGAGTIEFLYQDGEFYFIEMNTRLQVEHPVTEAITRIDLVREQIRVASGAPLSLAQKDVRFAGHAVECRINAEDPRTFRPTPGNVTDYHPPGGLGVRVDSGLYQGYRVPPYYDSLIAKLVVHGRNRNECLMRLRRCLEEFVIGGIDSTIPLHAALVDDPQFIDGDYTIHWLEQNLERLVGD